MLTILPESPQSVGDLVGYACRIVRGNLKEFWRFLLIPTILVSLAGVLFQWVFTYGVDNVGRTRDMGDAIGLFISAIVGLVVFAISWLVLNLRLLAIVRVALGFADNLEEGAKYMYARKWSVVGVYLIPVAILFTFLFAMVIMATLPAVFAGPRAYAAIGLSVVVSFAGIIAATTFYLLISHVALVMVACEDEPAAKVLVRSTKFIFGHLKRSLAFGTVFFIAFTVISYPLSLPIAAITFVDLMQHGLANMGADYKPPVYVLAISQFWEALTGMYLRPLIVIAFGLFYYDLRSRAEGFDIQRRIRAASALSGPV